jgi:hypothetical protein
MQKQEIMMICIYTTTREKKKIIYQKSSNVFQSLQKELSCKYQGKMENLDHYYTYTNKMKEKKI